MDNNNERIERLLHLINQLDPPDSLREQTLATAVQAMREPAGRPDAWTRIWQSRPLRLAWAVAVVALLAANIVLRPDGHKQENASATDNRLQMEELVDEVRLPRLRFSYLQPMIGAPTPTKKE